MTQLSSTTPNAGLGGLIQVLRKSAPGIIAFSGGLDSQVLAEVIARNNLRYTAVFLDTGLISSDSRAKAIKRLELSQLEHVILQSAPLVIPEVRLNDRQRCYHCKKHLFRRILGYAAERGLDCVIDGTNLSDTAEYRPGLRALQELKVASPFVLAAITKDEIRRIARHLGMADPERPSSPCLMTRFAYGLQATPELIAEIGRIEDELSRSGLVDFRLRMPGRDEFVLQMNSGNAETWREIEDKARSIMRDFAAQGMKVVFSERISGFFDHSPLPDGRA